MNARLLTTREVADWLGLSPATVLRRWRSGELPGIRMASNCLRFDPDEIRGYIDGLRPPRDEFTDHSTRPKEAA